MSLTISSLFVGVLVIVLQKAGFEVAPENIQTTFETLILVASAAGVYWGRIRQGDLNFLGVRK